MTEILTESFCERCGTRYTFESVRPKARLRGVKVLSRGLKNFVLSDDTSMNEAMAAARSESDRDATAHHLDAFHKTFNFCMSCRQYSCANCWNEAEARCLSCAPLAGQEALVTLDDLTALSTAVLVDATGAANGTSEAEATVEAETIVESVTAEPAVKAAEQTASLLRRFRPGENLDAELEAYERELADAGAPGPVLPVAERPAVAEGAAPAVEPEPAPAVEPEPAPAPQAAATVADVVEQPTWTITAPDAPTVPHTTVPHVADRPPPASPSAVELPGTQPQWPASPEWRTSAPTAGLPFLGRSAAPEGGIEALWAASNEELIANPSAPGKPAPSGIQPCVSCGLSLSASARFCRRCGTVQER